MAKPREGESEGLCIMVAHEHADTTMHRTEGCNDQVLLAETGKRTTIVKQLKAITVQLLAIRPLAESCYGATGSPKSVHCKHSGMNKVEWLRAER